MLTDRNVNVFRACDLRVTLRRALGESACGTVVSDSSRDEAGTRRAPAVSDASQRVIGVGDLRAAPRRGTCTHARKVSMHAGDPLTEAGRTIMNDVRPTVGQRRAVVSAGCCTRSWLDGRGLRAPMGAGQGEFGSCAHRLGTVIKHDSGIGHGFRDLRTTRKGGERGQRSESVARRHTIGRLLLRDY